jgi:tetratricopeptide (TPR) repeat protein
VTPGSRPWVVRSLRDWVLSVRQGMALVTYRSSAARELALRNLTLEFQASNRKVETLECGECTAEDFVSRIAKSQADVLLVLDPDRLLFGEDNERSPFWVNFHRETLAEHAGAQIWWMLPNAAIRFGQQLPDLSRFFLFREDLMDEVEIERDTSLDLQTSPGETSIGDPSRARDLLDRALRAAASVNVYPVRVWLELGIPAINEFLRSGQLNEGLDALRQLTGLVGAPEDALNAASGSDAHSVGSAFITLSTLYREVGRDDEALVAAENAVSVYRQQAQQRLPDLAASINNLALMLSDLGRREEALAQAEEAVSIYRQLAQQRPDAFLPNLAISLNNAANRLSDLGRREEALEEAGEALRIFSQLAQKSPDAFLPNLAASLNNMANRLGDLGRREEALEQAEEAVRIRRQLAQQSPDAFLPDLATSLNNLAPLLGALGRREEALKQAGEAVRIYRQLAQQRPDVFLPNTAGAVNNLANRLSALGRREEALEQAGEAVRIYRQLAQQRPDVFMPNMAGAMNNLAIRLSEVGRHEEALAQVEEAVRIRRQLAQRRPDAFVPDLATSLAVLSNITAEDRPGEALEALAQAIRLLTPLFSKLPLAHGRLMQNIYDQYLRAAEAANVAPDMTLLAPVIPILEKLNSSQHE